MAGANVTVITVSVILLNKSQAACCSPMLSAGLAQVVCTLYAADFLWLAVQHVLPKGFHRVHDYGLLRGKPETRRVCTMYMAGPSGVVMVPC